MPWLSRAPWYSAFSAEVAFGARFGDAQFDFGHFLFFEDAQIGLYFVVTGTGHGDRVEHCHLGFITARIAARRQARHDVCSVQDKGSASPVGPHLVVCQASVPGVRSSGM